MCIALSASPGGVQYRAGATLDHSPGDVAEFGTKKMMGVHEVFSFGQNPCRYYHKEVEL